MIRMAPLQKSVGLAGLAAVLVFGLGTAQATTLEEVVDVQVQVTDTSGLVVSQPIKVTIFRDDSRSRSPFLILNHGRAVDAEDRAKQGRFRLSDNAQYLVSKGFAVFIPTRVGYGVTGGPDVENSGPCRTKKYPPAYEAAVQQSIQVIAYAKALPYVDPARGLVMGQSFGGATAIALASKKVPGVIAAVNFAGGGGGNPLTQPGRPCRNDLLTDLFSSYGATARIPTLWLYSENDMYFGKENPHAWFKGFVAPGGKGTFVQLPPLEPDGHGSFTRNTAAWRPAFEDFLHSCCGGIDDGSGR